MKIVTVFRVADRTLKKPDVWNIYYSVTAKWETKLNINDNY